MSKKCPRCDGSGSIDCPKCEGKGHIELYTKMPILSDLIDAFRDTTKDIRPCEKCNETGEVRCPNCNGSGYL